MYLIIIIIIVVVVIIIITTTLMHGIYSYTPGKHHVYREYLIAAIL